VISAMMFDLAPTPKIVRTNNKICDCFSLALSVIPAAQEKAKIVKLRNRIALVKGLRTGVIEPKAKADQHEDQHSQT